MKLQSLCEHMRLGMSSCGCLKKCKNIVGVGEFSPPLSYPELV